MKVFINKKIPEAGIKMLEEAGLEIIFPGKRQSVL